MKPKPIMTIATEKNLFEIIGTKGEYYVYLFRKTIPNISNIRRYKVGMIAAEVKDGWITLYRRTNKKTTGREWTKLKTFKPTFAQDMGGRIEYFTRKFFHKSIPHQVLTTGGDVVPEPEDVVPF